MERKDLQELFEQSTQAEEKFIPKDNKKPILIASIILAVGFLATATLIYLNRPQNKPIENTKKIVETQLDNIQTSELNLPEWAKKEWRLWNELDKESILETQADSFISSFAEIYPSEQEGFTVDVHKQFDADGLPNPLYTELTREEFVLKMTSALSRITNPMVGGWKTLQSPHWQGREYIESTVYDRLATADYLDKVFSGEQSHLIFYDVNKNNYDEALPGNDSRKAKFVGIIQSGTIALQDNQFHVHLVVDYQTAPERTFKTKTLDFDMVFKEGHFYITGGTMSE